MARLGIAVAGTGCLPVPMQAQGQGQDISCNVLMRRGVLAAGVEDFDAGLFRISPAEAAAMDAQQRLLLEAAHLVIPAAQPAHQRPAAARNLVAALPALLALCL